MARRHFHFTVKVTGPITIKVTGFAVTTLVLSLSE
ncbi:MAG: hypothetical protein JWQ81_7 [Amycolatopsis sp.]|nr:hypothetical protein [Amycolatopsis sp.]